MVYKHRTQKGKLMKFSNKGAYENWKRGMFANLQSSNSSMRKITKAKTKSKRRLQHRGIGKVSSVKKKRCETCKGLSLTEGRCKVCAKEFKEFGKRKENFKSEIAELRRIKDGYQEEVHSLLMKKMRFTRGFGDHLPFPEEERLQELLQLYSEAHDKWSKKVKEYDPDYFKKGINTFRLGHEVDIKGKGKEFCSMCKREGQSLSKGKCKFCREHGKEYEKESDKRKADAEKRSMDEYIVDRISGGWGELKKAKQGKDNTRIIYYKHLAYEPQNASYIVQRVNEVTEPHGWIKSPYTAELREFPIRSGGIIAAIRKAKEYYESLE